jgi:hypothetical protein
MPIAYGTQTWSTGPTIAGCTMSGSSITLRFNKTLLGAGSGEAIAIQPYYKGGVVVGNKAYSVVGSKMEVLVNASDFCMQEESGGCRDDGTGMNYSRTINESAWIAVDVTAGSSPDEVVVDLTRSGGVAYAIRYAWTGDCCSSHPPTSDPCPIASCPIMGGSSKLPANPFIAHIADNRCRCVAPQVCSA